MLKGPAVKVGGRGRGIHFTLDDEVPFDQLERSIRDYLDSANGFFLGARASVDAGRRLADARDMARVRQLIEEEYHLEICEVRSRTERLELGLTEATGIPTTILPRESAPFLERTLLVRGARRSGTSMHHEGDLVVLGDVNPGAEVTAAGDILVFGSLLGAAGAGTTGDEGAVVVALTMNPTQLRIGRYLRVALGETKRKKPRGLRPEVAFVRGDEIVVEPFCGRLQQLRALEGM